jgi:hypothetical protein
MRRRLSNDKAAFFGKIGYAAKLRDLPGSMGRYNGILVKPKPCGGGMFEIVIERGEKRVELVIKENNLEAVVEYNDCAPHPHETKVQKRKKQKRAFKLTNRSNTGVAFDDISSQLRAAIKREAKKQGSLEEVFGAFDIDGNGTIEKKELMHVCKALDLRISLSEMDLIWPMFDIDNNGVIDVEEFVKFTTMKPITRRCSRNPVEMAKHSASKRIAHVARQQRIKKKGWWKKRLAEIRTSLVNEATAYVQEQSIDIQTVFHRIDAYGDGNGEIGRTEFIVGLKEVIPNTQVTAKELEAIWPLLTCVSSSGNCSLPQWIEFISSSRIPMRFMSDKLLRLYDEIETLPEYVAMQKHQCTFPTIAEGTDERKVWSEGDRVKIAKDGSHKGELAWVVDANWEGGRVQVRMDSKTKQDGEPIIKSYHPNELESGAQRTNKTSAGRWKTIRSELRDGKRKEGHTATKITNSEDIDNRNLMMSTSSSLAQVHSMKWQVRLHKMPTSSALNLSVATRRHRAARQNALKLTQARSARERDFTLNILSLQQRNFLTDRAFLRQKELLKRC